MIPNPIRLSLVLYSASYREQKMSKKQHIVGCLSGCFCVTSNRVSLVVRAILFSATSDFDAADNKSHAVRMMMLMIAFSRSSVLCSTKASTETHFFLPAILYKQPYGHYQQPGFPSSPPQPQHLIGPIRPISCKKKRKPNIRDSR